MKPRGVTILTAALSAILGGSLGLVVGLSFAGWHPPAKVAAVARPSTALPDLKPSPRILALLRIYREGRLPPDMKTIGNYMQNRRKADLAEEALAREAPGALAVEEEMERQAAARARNRELDDMIRNSETSGKNSGK